MIIQLIPERTSNRVRVGLGLTLRTKDGVAVRGYVTHADYDKIAALEDGRVGILRREMPQPNPMFADWMYWLEV